MPSFETLAAIAVALLSLCGWLCACARADDLRQDIEDQADDAADLRDDLATARKRTADAEMACELLRQSVMRGSAVTTWTWPEGTRPAAADASYFHVKTAHGDLLLTEEAFAVALERANKNLTRSH
jgi:hypothetical protein